MTSQGIVSLSRYNDGPEPWETDQPFFAFPIAGGIRDREHINDNISFFT